MTAIEKRLLTCRLLEAMIRDPEFSKKLKLKNVSIKKYNQGEEEKRDG